ncbi:MAG: ribbon-helix-helix protein, CopG family [Patescibacteria group bacterium]
MKIYFTASLKQSKRFSHIFDKIIAYLENNNHEVFEALHSKEIGPLNDLSQYEIRKLQEELLSEMSDCDCALVEGSYPSSIFVGYELGQLISKQKPTILLYKKGLDPVFIAEDHSSRLIKSEYEEDMLEEVIDWCLEEVGSISKRRFTFYISPEIDGFLEQIANNSGTSRSEYIRDLIEKEIEGSSQD